MNAALKAYDLSLEAANAYRDFMGGVAKALGHRPNRQRCDRIAEAGAGGAAQLAEVARGPPQLPTRIAAIVAPLAATPSLDAIMPLKDEAQSVRAAFLRRLRGQARGVEPPRAGRGELRAPQARLAIAAALGALLVMGFTAFILRRLVRGILMPLAETVADDRHRGRAARHPDRGARQRRARRCRSR